MNIKQRWSVMRVAVAFFGLTRSLSYTYNSIWTHFLLPLADVAHVSLFMHTYRATTLSNPRSKEVNVPLCTYEWQFLAPYYDLEIEDQADALESLHPEQYRTKADPWGDNYKSLNNLLLQLHSLKRVTLQWTRAIDNGATFDVVIFARFDCIFFCPFDTNELSAVDSNTFFSPTFSQHGGLNDRFGFGSASVMARYGSRFDGALQFSRNHPLHAETYLAHVMSGLTLRGTSVKLGRVRANGVLWDTLDSRHGVRIARRKRSLQKFAANFARPTTSVLDTSRFKVPRVVVLTRTSGRPSEFRTCHESVVRQSHPNVFHVVCADTAASFAYARDATCHCRDALVIRHEAYERRDFMHFPFNLYLNEMLRYANMIDTNAFVVVLDDDDMFTTDQALSMAVARLQTDKRAKMVQWRVKIGKKLYPPLGLCESGPVQFRVDMNGIMSHISVFDDFVFCDQRGEDFRFLKSAHDRHVPCVWLNHVLTSTTWTHRDVKHSGTGETNAHVDETRKTLVLQPSAAHALRGEVPATAVCFFGSGATAMRKRDMVRVVEHVRKLSKTVAAEHAGKSADTMRVTVTMYQIVTPRALQKELSASVRHRSRGEQAVLHHYFALLLACERWMAGYSRIAFHRIVYVHESYVRRVADVLSTTWRDPFAFRCDDNTDGARLLYAHGEALRMYECGVVFGSLSLKTGPVDRAVIAAQTTSSTTQVERLAEQVLAPTRSVELVGNQVRTETCSVGNSRVPLLADEAGALPPLQTVDAKSKADKKARDGDNEENGWKDFDWIFYLSQHGNLRMRGILTESAARAHYLKSGAYRRKVRAISPDRKKLAIVPITPSPWPRAVRKTFKMSNAFFAWHQDAFFQTLHPHAYRRFNEIADQSSQRPETARISGCTVLVVCQLHSTQVNVVNDLFRAVDNIVAAVETQSNVETVFSVLDDDAPALINAWRERNNYTFACDVCKIANIGMDIGGFMTVLDRYATTAPTTGDDEGKLPLERFDVVVKIHTKTSPKWRSVALSLFSSAAAVRGQLEAMREMPEIGMFGAAELCLQCHELKTFTINREWEQRILGRTTVANERAFVAGSIFMVRATVLEEMVKRMAQIRGFARFHQSAKAGYQKDSKHSVIHCFERMFGYFVRATGRHIIPVHWK